MFVIEFSLYAYIINIVSNMGDVYMATKEKKPNKVYETLKEDILHMKIKPGTAIGEVDIANKFGVSRTPVRDAIRRLESEGLVEVKSHIGTYVTLIDLDQVADVIYMREKIEKAVIEDFSRVVNNKGSLRLVYNLNKQKELLDSDIDDSEIAVQFMILDNEFHKIIFELTGRVAIWEYLQTIEYHYDRFRIFVNEGSREKNKKLYEEHVELLQSIRKGNFDKVFSIYENHLYYGVRNGTQDVLRNKQYFTIINHSQTVSYNLC